jgi:hypothetical protein
MPAKNHGHGPFPQWTSDDRFCLVAVASCTQDREQAPRPVENLKLPVRRRNEPGVTPNNEKQTAHYGLLLSYTK